MPAMLKPWLREALKQLGGCSIQTAVQISLFSSAVVCLLEALNAGGLLPY